MVRPGAARHSPPWLTWPLLLLLLVLVVATAASCQAAPPEAAPPPPTPPPASAPPVAAPTPTAPAVPATGDATVRVMVNGREVASDVPPVIVAGRLLLPMRALFAAIGARVEWDPVARAASATLGEHELSLVVGATVARLDGRPLVLDVPARIQAGRTLVPVRFVGESLGARVEWVAATRTATVDFTGAPTLQPPPTTAPPALRLEPVVSGLVRPLHVGPAPDGSGRLFVLEQPGRIRVIEAGRLLTEPFLDLSAQVMSRGNEQGLLGLAFHPNYRSNGLLYVNYTRADGATVVARYRTDPDHPRRADPATTTVLLTVPQPYANHNGGHVAFGPDGYLYIGLGDGGSAGDPRGNGQNPATLLGSLLRIDVDGGTPYAIPADNPFAAGGGRPETWAYGLRNPWRYSFDRETGDLYIADVGQNAVEEINFQLGGSPGGQNYGWNAYEGSRPYAGARVSGTVFPVAAYTHAEGGCSVTGGYVYRGRELLHLAGTYLYGDYCAGKVWGLRRSRGQWQTELLLETGLRISAFGEDAAGELYIVDHGGTVYRLTAG